MKRTLGCSATWARRFHTSRSRGLPALARVESGALGIPAFRHRVLAPKQPWVLRQGAGSPATKLHAPNKWFRADAAAGRALSDYMAGFEEWPFPYELVQLSPETKQAVAGFHNWLMRSADVIDRAMAGTLQTALSEDRERGFVQFNGPLRLLIKALEFNRTQRWQASGMVQLYIAQSALSDLPRPLQNDVPAPELVRRAGKGDMYGSSIWLGTEPTFTPLHRDPNPNLFCQLCGCKIVRLFTPRLGETLYCQVQAKIRQQGNSRIRTTEMMEGREREALHDAAWHCNDLPEECYETRLAPGDSLFIPDGWWHSVKSAEANGQLNGSVNWWFR